MQQSLIRFILILLPISILACSNNEPKSSYVPDFEISEHPSDANVYVFENTTEGEHFFWRWEFGNGDRTDREPVETNPISSFYPEKGTYEVTLTIWGSSSDLADNKAVTRQLTVSDDVFNAAFSVEAVAGKVNTYALSNQTDGEYEHITWLVNGKELEEANQTVEVYFPFKGKNEVSLVVSVGDYQKEVTETVDVATDDPDFKSHYTLVWNDEFDGNVIDTDKWKFETGQHGWGNNEWQNYTDGANVEVSDGTLKITAKLVGEGQKVGDYTSTRLNSKKSFTYGLYEVKAKMPEEKGPGHWPAIWMLGESIQNGTSWPLCGEIDIMEYVSWDPNMTSSSIHTQSNNHAQGNPIGSGHLPLETAEEEFHVYGFIWTENFLRFYRDDVDNVILTYNKPTNPNQENWPFDEPFYYLLNVAVGGMYGGVNGVDDSIFPASMEVDYVRVYQID
ncbi:glycoside hydrolase family 16 protein [Carboxylicivirga sp. A043]|uniref:glycoside hydrolase family 16 protein n=1 Tax=Carboxylicivirga litoralis TaxID=2816963 RepID=UPI0021CB78C6|nr:glycoside hydrolase family 16 protein [Carboxylicivirga sp. A043]MCU4156444.1 glycoside hydrolase family 16 protein [Carboxylicivirga sp. A043]